MKKIFQLFFLLLIAGAACIAQMPDTTGNIRPRCNTPGYEFPQIDKEMRAIFRLKAPYATKVQIDLSGMDDGVMGVDSFWTITTKAIAPGFNYYFLVIDGVKVADPASESYWGTGKRSSGIEVPTTGEDFYMAKDVPHGEVRSV